MGTFIIISLSGGSEQNIGVKLYSRIFPLQLGNFRSRDVFRPIALEQKYLMDYND